MEQHSNDQQTGLWARLKERAAAWNDPEARQQRGRRAGQRRRLARGWARIHLRRAAPWPFSRLSARPPFWWSPPPWAWP